MSRTKSQARRAAVQALYQWQMTGDNLQEIVRQFELHEDFRQLHAGYFKTLIQGVVDDLGDLDTEISRYIDRDLDKVDPVEKAILRLGVFELMRRPEVPYRVVINEGINLAKCFGAVKSHAYVNSVLDKVAAQCRSVEMSGVSQDRA